VIMEVIYRVKVGDYTAKERLLRVAQHFIQRGAEGLILGCTELSLIMKQEDADCPVFDPLSVLSRRAVMLVKDGRNDQEP
jgi:aspartate racemase